MKISTKLVVLFGLLFGSVTANAVENTTTVGLSSDYFWRGVSQTANSHPVLSIGTEFSTESGFYVGVWGSEVDFVDNEASIEYDFYGGYNLFLSENVSVGLGAIRYSYDQDIDYVDEVFVTASYRMLEVAYYQNPDDVEADYLSVTASIPGISVVDVALQYGQFGDGTDHKGVTISKSLTDKIDVSLMVRSSVRSNQFWDNAAASISYTF